MKVEDDRYFLSQLKRHEGFSLEAYRCSAGVLTIGWGHNCKAQPVSGVQKAGDVISRGTAENLLYGDVKAVAAELDDRLPWWREMGFPRQAVFLNMAFNMGVPKFLRFKKALSAAKAGDWNGTAREMLDSRWSEQVKNRSAELATQMGTGAWQEG